ncbi:MAG TPA: hypothetical protein VI411_03995 [Actinomycetota bacterium]
MAVENAGFGRRAMFEELVGEEDARREDVEPLCASGRSHAEVIEVIEPHLDVASLALVGHEPNLSELASILLTGRPTSLTMDVKKGGVAHLWLQDGLRRGTASLRWLVTPKVLRSLSG